MHLEDRHSPRVDGWLERTSPSLSFSVWTIAEFSSALSLRKRLGALSRSEREHAEEALDRWLARQPKPIAPRIADFEFSRRILRAEDSLRAPDALHLALVQRAGNVLATLDQRMAEAARRVGIEVAEI